MIAGIIMHHTSVVFPHVFQHLHSKQCITLSTVVVHQQPFRGIVFDGFSQISRFHQLNKHHDVGDYLRATVVIMVPDKRQTTSIVDDVPFTT